MPWLPGRPRRAPVAFMLTSISYGSIGFDVVTTSQTISCCIHDIDDSLIMFVRFARFVRDGACPQAALVSHPRTFFVVQKMPDVPGHVRLVVSQNYEGTLYRLDIHLGRAALLDALHTFLTCIAHDETQGHMFLCFCDIEESRYDPVADQMEAEWRAAADAGLEDPDDPDAEYRFCGRRFAALYALSPWQAEYVQAYRDILPHPGNPCSLAGTAVPVLVKTSRMPSIAPPADSC